MGACDVARHLRNVAERRNRNPREHTMRRQDVFVDYHDRNMQRVVKKIITAIFSDLFLLDIRSINLNLNIQNLQSKLKNLFYFSC